jgi:hypothetical protein
MLGGRSYHDICVANRWNSHLSSHTYLGDAYTNDTGLVGDQFFTGESNCNMKENDVFQVIDEIQPSNFRLVCQFVFFQSDKSTNPCLCCLSLTFSSQLPFRIVFILCHVIQEGLVPKYGSHNGINFLPWTTKACLQLTSHISFNICQFASTFSPWNAGCRFQ